MLKKKNDNNVMILVLALILALVAAFVGQIAIKSHLELVPIYKIAEPEIAPRTVLTNAHIMKSEIPKSEVHPNAVKNKEDILGKAMTTHGFYGQQIIQNMLSDAERANGLTQEISQGKRALSIPVNIYSSFGGNIEKTDRVDIIGNFEEVGDYASNFSRILLSNVKILEIVKEADEVLMIIVEVTPTEAEIIEYAKLQGNKLGIALVPYGENRTNTYGIDAENFLEQYMPR
jgi:Flp pilus assembly protein CpaB